MTRGASAAPRALALVVAAVLTAVGFANDYYPRGAGLSWTYSSGETQTMGGTRVWNGLEVSVLTHYLDGVPVSEDYLTFDADGVRTHGTASGGTVVRYDPPLLIYAAAPLQPGATWSTTTEVAGLAITLSSEVVGMRGVQTPAGRFNALQIRQRTLTSTGGRTLLDVFLVPGVGTVRFVTEDGTVIDLIELGR